ncbi:hypothetical protein DFH09DRAFT_1089771 [Mycena vulgaris]|nr:hypothetical protein DFH09DRAFT_1089771 [Mycena vulgaris]
MELSVKICGTDLWHLSIFLTERDTWCAVLWRAVRVEKYSELTRIKVHPQGKKVAVNLVDRMTKITTLLPQTSASRAPARLVEPLRAQETRARRSNTTSDKLRYARELQAYLDRRLLRFSARNEFSRISRELEKLPNELRNILSSGYYSLCPDRVPGSKPQLFAANSPGLTVELPNSSIHVEARVHPGPKVQINAEIEDYILETVYGRCVFEFREVCPLNTESKFNMPIVRSPWAG